MNKFFAAAESQDCQKINTDWSEIPYGYRIGAELIKPAEFVIFIFQRFVTVKICIRHFSQFFIPRTFSIALRIANIDCKRRSQNG